MRANLVKYDNSVWTFRPSNPSKACLGWCSKCSIERKATHMLIGQANRPVAALCANHVKLWNLMGLVALAKEAIRLTDIVEDYEKGLRLVQ